MIGTTIQYWGVTPPANTIEANGASFDVDLYPELAKVFPDGKVIDLRGCFIRGKGGKSAALGVLQAYANDGHTHTLSGTTTPGAAHTHSYVANPVQVYGGGEGGNRESNGPQTGTTGAASGTGSTISGTTAATASHVATEVRPINKSCWLLFEVR